MNRPSILLVSCLLSGMTPSAMFAQDKSDTGDATDKVENVVEERADEEAAGTESEDADVGEASYNIEDCAPAVGEGGGENGIENGEEGRSEADAIDDCEKMVK